MGTLTLPASGLVYLDANPVIYTVEKHPVYGPLLQPHSETGKRKGKIRGDRLSSDSLHSLLACTGRDCLAATGGSARLQRIAGSLSNFATART